MKAVLGGRGGVKRLGFFKKLIGPPLINMLLYVLNLAVILFLKIMGV